MPLRLLVLSDLHLEFMGYEQPNWICIPCGDAWRLGEWDRTMSCHTGDCGICGRDEIAVTSPDCWAAVCFDVFGTLIHYAGRRVNPYRRLIVSEARLPFLTRNVGSGFHPSPDR